MYYIQNLPGINEESFLSLPIWKSMLDCVLLSLDLSPLHFLFWDFLMKTSVPMIPRQAKSWRMPSTGSSVIYIYKSQQGSHISGDNQSSGGDPARESSNGVVYCWILQPRAGMPGDIVNLLCHVISNRLIYHFGKCDVQYQNYKENTCILLTVHPVDVNKLIPVRDW